MAELAAILERRKKKSDVETEKATVSGAGGELAAKLERRSMLNDNAWDPLVKRKNTEVFNPYTEFPEFSRAQIKSYKDTYKKFNVTKEGLGIEELKKLMEHIGHPQTHVGLLQMLREIDTSRNGRITEKEFFMIFRKAADGELSDSCSGLSELCNAVNEVNVSEVGVSGAKDFFQQKITEISKSNAAEEEIRAEQRQAKEEAERKMQAKADFKARIETFGGDSSSSKADTATVAVADK